MCEKCANWTKRFEAGEWRGFYVRLRDLHRRMEDCCRHAAVPGSVPSGEIQDCLGRIERDWRVVEQEMWGV